MTITCIPIVKDYRNSFTNASTRSYLWGCGAARLRMGGGGGVTKPHIIDYLYVFMNKTLTNTYTLRYIRG